ncbi:MAG: DNA polymerase III subunit delta' [Hyphomicrobiaceae bacterium]
MARAPREQTIEVYPEADRLDPFPHPRHTEVVFGHTAAEAQLAAGLSGGNLHHAWLLVGPSGVGKATLAYRFARAALSGAEGDGPALLMDEGKLPVNAGSKASHLVRALSHPDLLVLRRPYDIKAKRFKTNITVDEVRRLRDFLGHKQSGRGWKVVIVDSADELNVNAANALLKSLEEPPAGAIFFLISSMPGRLLTTIRSRCRQLTMHPLGDTDLQAAAGQALTAAELEMPDSDAWPLLLRSSAGSVGRLLRLASDDGIALSKKVDQVFGNLRRPDWPLLHQLSDEFAAVAAGEKFEAFIDLLLARLARTVRAAATGQGDSVDLDTVRKLGTQADLASWAALWETLVREKSAQGALNLDRKAFVLDCVTRLNRLAGRN